MYAGQSEDRPLSTRNDYTVQQWNAIAAAPAAAALSIACVDGNSLAPADDAAVGRAIVRSARGDAPEIVKVLVDSVQRRGCRAAMPEGAACDHDGRTDALIAAVARAVYAVSSTSPAEVEPFKAWLAAVAAKLFRAAKDARVPPMDPAPVTRAEEEAIERLAGVLGVSAPSPADHAVRACSHGAVAMTAAALPTRPLMGQWNHRRSVLRRRC